LGRGGPAGSAWTARSGASYFLAAILFVLGLLGLLYADVFRVASIVGFGVLLVAGGIAELFHALRTRSGGDRFLVAFLSGLLSMAVGVVLASRPAVGVTGTGLLVGAWLLGTGLFRGAAAITERHRAWGWDLGYGVLSVLLGFWVTGTLPSAAMWLLGTAVSIELMIRAVAVMGSSVPLHQRERSSAHAG
jgi:uncharacterized membrane protein HdeD (DUF308 family)